MRRTGRIASMLAVVGMTMGGGLVLAPTALAATPATGYGAGAQYQVELSSNVPGEGFWLWVELGGNGTSGNYEETDCLHLGGGHATDVAAHDAGDVTSWQVVSGVLIINGVNVLGGLETATISVPLPSSGFGSVSAMTVTITSAIVPIIPVGASITFPANGAVAP